MSSDCRIGTPDDSSVDKIREKRATATFRKMLPKMGVFNNSASICQRPFGVL